MLLRRSGREERERGRKIEGAEKSSQTLGRLAPFCRLSAPAASCRQQCPPHTSPPLLSAVVYHRRHRQRHTNTDADANADTTTPPPSRRHRSRGILSNEPRPSNHGPDNVLRAPWPIEFSRVGQPMPSFLSSYRSNPCPLSNAATTHRFLLLLFIFSSRRAPRCC